MSEIVIEQAIYGGQNTAAYRLLGRSAGFVDEWLPEVHRLCTSFGDRPAGLLCPSCVFAAPFNRRQVAVVRVADQGADAQGRPGALAFHFVILDQSHYQAIGGDPFYVADQFPPPWQACGELPTLTWPEDAHPRRTIAALQAVLKRSRDGATLLGGAQALVDGGRVVFERPAPDTDLIRNLWQLLPTTTRFYLWPASFAFGNALGFDALVVPGTPAEEYAGYVTEQQAGDYPQGQYELNLQMAVEAGDQRELDFLLARRSRRETWRLGLLLLCLIIVLVVVGKWLTPAPQPAPRTKVAPAGEQKANPREQGP